MQTEPITRALKTLEDAGIDREQSMATVKAIAEMQQPLLDAINRIEASINDLRIDMVKRDVRLAKRDTWMIVTGTAVALSAIGIFLRSLVIFG